MQGPVVVDAAVFNKLFLDETDRKSAVSFFEHAKSHGLRLIAPSLLLYEVLAVAGPTSIGSAFVYDLILRFRNSGFELLEIDDAVIRKALQISNTGHPKSGYPTFYDSTYHALALINGGVFLTSDQRHVAKAAAFGGVVMLEDWRTHFQ
jgi:predicted nucleic acid-binding protein